MCSCVRGTQNLSQTSEGKSWLLKEYSASIPFAYFFRCIPNSHIRVVQGCWFVFQIINPIQFYAKSECPSHCLNIHHHFISLQMKTLNPFLSQLARLIYLSSEIQVDLTVTSNLKTMSIPSFLLSCGKESRLNPQKLMISRPETQVASVTNFSHSSCA